MADPLKLNKKIQSFDRKITVNEASDKSLSIRWAIIASMAKGKSKAYNLLRSEDVLSTLRCLRQLGVKIKLTKKFCEITGNSLNGYVHKNNLLLNAGNSGTAARLITSILINSSKTIKITGDNSLRKREIIGEHEVKFSSGKEIITLNHEAFDRALYSEGALTATKWLINKKPGLYSMRDVLNFKQI